VSIHRLEADYDTGDVLAVERLAIDPSWNAWQLARALDRPSLRLLRSTVNAFARGEPPAPVPQDEALVTYAPFPDDDDCAIQWSRTTAEVLRHVRALAPAPGAWTDIVGVTVTVLEARAATSYPSILLPGEAVWDGERCVVRTADGAVDLLRIEIEGLPATARQLRALMTGPAVIG
jgi:methionyl-tRNA formyltransferase